jgi:hypothetical protein
MKDKTAGPPTALCVIGITGRWLADEVTAGYFIALHK